MKKFMSLLAFAMILCACAGVPTPPEPQYSDSEIFMTPKKTFVEIPCIYHGSIAIYYQGTCIQVDPVAGRGDNAIDYSQFGKADYIFITHEHGDHLSPDVVETVSSDKTVIFSNQKSYDTVLKRGQVLSNGDEGELTSSISYKVVPAYNTTDSKLHLHPKGNGNGYVFNIDGLVVYVSGDTEPIEDMKTLGSVDVAFLAVNSPTMSIEQCIDAAKMISPKVLIPYHLSQTDMQAIKDGLEGAGIDVRLHESLR